MFGVSYQCVAITQDAIYVMNSTKPSGGAKPVTLIGTLARHTRLGPVSGRWSEMDLLGQRHWVHRRFYPEIIAADAAAGFSD
jgi:hypothetical protein